MMVASVATLALAVGFLLADPAARPIAVGLEPWLQRCFRLRLSASDGLARFVSVTITMLSLSALACWLFVEDVAAFWLQTADPIFAVGLGIACFGMSQIPASLLGLLPVFRQDQASGGKESLNRKATSAGWLRYYRDVYEAGKVPLIVLVFLYVTTEEILFRIVLTALWGETPLCLVISTALFALAQIPGYRRHELRFALYPVVGALVVGPIHLYYFWQTHSIWLLSISHLTFFLAGFLIQMRMEMPSKLSS